MQKSIIKQIRISEQQAETLDILKSYNVNISMFIRTAIKEKISKDWPQIKADYQKSQYPFYNH